MAGISTTHTQEDSVNDILKALALEYGDYRTHGYSVEAWGDGFICVDPEGGHLMSGGEGVVVKRKSTAELEAYRRIAEDQPGPRPVALLLESLLEDLGRLSDALVAEGHKDIGDRVLRLAQEHDPLEQTAVPA